MYISSFRTIFKNALTIALALSIFALADSANAQTQTETLSEKTEIEALPDNEQIKESELKIAINLPAYELNLIENGQVIKTYKVAIAAAKYSMPMEDREAVRVIWNPRWTPPPSDWAKNERPYAPGEPGNPLGRVKILIGGNYLIHGGGDKSVGRAASHGCIRMRNADVQELARLIVSARNLSITEQQIKKLEENGKMEYGLKIDSPIPVEINYEPLKIENGLVEIHPDVYKRGTNSMENLREALSSAGIHYGELSMYDQLSLVRALKDAERKPQRVELITVNQKAETADSAQEPTALLPPISWSLFR